MAAFAELKETNQRERGTLKDTLPRRPIVLVALVCVASATLADLLFVYSSHAPTSANDMAKMWIMACLGAISASVGIIFGDSLSHIFAFGIARLFIGYGDIKSSLIAVSPPLTLAALASMQGPRSIISSLDSSFLLTPVILQVCCLLPFLSVIFQSNVNPEYLNISIIPSCFVVFATLLLMYVYNTNRQHKNGHLLSSEMKSQAICSGLSILLSCSITEMKLNESADAIVVFLLGSLFLILMSLVFAFVADHWYAVGSGQFQMVSLDTVGIFVYVVTPVIILYLRFLDKYGESFASKYTVLEEYLQSTGILSKGDVYEDVISLSLVMTLAMITSVGVPLLNALCPIGGYLFSRSYTHGQPSTKKVALCINFSDLPISCVPGMADIWNCLENKIDDQPTAVLNIMVTLEELMQNPTEMELIAGKGHAIALVPTDFKETGLDMFRSKSTCNLQIAHQKHPEIKWMLAKDSTGRHPSLLSEANDLGIKIVYWSTLVQLSGNKLTSKQKDAVIGDCSDKNGGSIIRATLEKGVSSGSVTTSICDLIDLFQGVRLESLSVVVRDDLSHIIER